MLKKTESNKTISGISISFNEPTLSLEYSLDVFSQCKNETYRMLVTNGYMTNETLDLFIQAGMTGMSVTIKGNSDEVKKYCSADVEKVWNNIEKAHRNGIHIEIVCLTIPTVNDSVNFFKQIAQRIVDINSNIPLHFTRFYPDYNFKEVKATPVKTLEIAHQIAHEKGVNFIYIGNVPGHPLENTYCPKCSNIIIQRNGYEIKLYYNIQPARCPFCDEKIPIFLGKQLNY